MDRIIRNRVFFALIALFLFTCLGAISAPVRDVSASVPPEQVEHRSMPEERFEFHYIRRYQPAVDRLVSEAPAILERAQFELGIDEMPVVEVWVLPLVADYFELKGQPNRAPDWAVGLSLSGLSTIILAHGGERAPEEVFLTFAHELAHVAVDRARAQKSVPRWFHEGFAVYLAQEWSAERSERLSRAAASDQLRSFDSLSRSFPAHHMSASLAYDQSFHFVRWLRAEFGAQFWAEVMGAMADKPEIDFEGAIEAVSGEPLSALELRWGEEIAASSSNWSILAEETIFFFGASVLFVLAYVSVRRQRRRRRSSLADDPGDEWSYDPARYPLPGEEHE